MCLYVPTFVVVIVCMSNRRRVGGRAGSRFRDELQRLGSSNLDGRKIHWWASLIVMRSKDGTLLNTLLTYLRMRKTQAFTLRCVPHSIYVGWGSRRCRRMNVLVANSDERGNWKGTWMHHTISYKVLVLNYRCHRK